MKTSFNLKKFYRKAYYDDGKGLTQRLTRAYMNCQKAKLEKGMKPGEAWNSCLEEFQEMSSGDWATKYA